MENPSFHKRKKPQFTFKTRKANDKPSDDSNAKDKTYSDGAKRFIKVDNKKFISILVRLTVVICCVVHYVVFSANATNIKRKESAEKQKQHYTAFDDGCGLVDNRHMSSWVPMTKTENDNVVEVQQCLKRTTGWDDHSKLYTNVNPRAIKEKLNCNIPVSFETLRSTLLKFDTVWFLGDSIMAQNFYTLSCIIDPSRGKWDGAQIRKFMGLSGLGTRTPEQFHYSHIAGSTRFLYSRFGRQWYLDSNLFDKDFPEATKVSQH